MLTTPIHLDGIWWLLLTLGPLLILQRLLHREVQAIFLLITRRVDIAMMLFSLVFFPGVLLHEGSHYLMARLLGVPTGRFSLVPHPLPNGKLQLGYVETASTDWLRDALVGAAPLLAGGLFVAYAGLARLGLLTMWRQYSLGGPPLMPGALQDAFNQPDFWPWFYLTFSVSSTMLPSASDRRAWVPLTFTVIILLGLSLIAGAGPWLAANLASPLNLILQSVAVVFGISILVHLVLLPPLWVLRHLISWVTGLELI